MGAPEKQVRALIEAWNARDVEAIRSLVHDDIVWINPPNALEPGTRVGRDALIEVFQAQWPMVDTIEIERLEHREGSVLTASRVTATIPGSDGRVETRVVTRWLLRDGLISASEQIGAGSDFEQALEAAGLKGSGEPTEERPDGQDTA